MKKTIILLYAVCFCLFTAPSHAAFFQPSMEVYTLKTDNFYIHYPKEAADVAQDLSEIAERVHTNLSAKLRWNPWGRTHIVLVDATDQANGLATVIPANYLLLYITPPDAESTLDSYKNYLELLFTHEYTHILHIDQHHRLADPFRWVLGKIVAPNGLTPGWMREGIAAWQETVESGPGRGNFSYSDMMLRTAIYEDDFPSIDEVAGIGLKWPQSNSSYIYGVKFFQWLAQNYGEDRITKYAEEYASGLWLFSLNNKARRVFNKSFYQLWREWQDDLRVKYAELKTSLSDKGITPFVPFVQHKKDQLSHLVYHPSGTGYAYSQAGIDEDPRVVIVTDPKEKPILIKKGTYGQMAYSRDGGNYLAFSIISGVEPYRSYSDVYLYDLKKKSMARVYEKADVKKSLRASDPDFSPLDGGNRWIVMVRTDLGTDNLYVYDNQKKAGYYLTNSSKYTQFSNPRYSPSGDRIVVSRRDHLGTRDIVVYDKTGKEIRKLTNDEAIDNAPIWSADGRSIYFESDASGVPNIHRIDANGGKPVQITNVLTGVYEPQITPDSQKLGVRYYSNKGTDLYQVNISELGQHAGLSSQLAPKSIAVIARPKAEAISSASSSDSNEIAASTNTAQWTRDGTAGNLQHPQSHLFSAMTPNAAAGTKVPINESAGYEKEENQPATTTSTEKLSEYESLLQGKTPPPAGAEQPLPGSKKYSAFPQVLVPRYLAPTFTTLDSGVLIGVSTGRFDPMYRHNWNLYANYRTDAAFLGGGGLYTYTRYAPTIYTGFARYALNYGDIFRNGSDFFEQRIQGFGGVSFGMGHHAFNVGYFYEDRKELTQIPFGFILPNLAPYAGFRTSYTYSRTKQFLGSISRETGPYLNLGFDITDSVLGADSLNEQRVFTGDFRYYFEMPWADHHVFGLRAAGGFAKGDPQFQGTFRLGGPFGEGTLAGYSPRVFPLRGLATITFSGERAMLFSAEYRLPLATIDRGIGTWPIYVRKIHMSFFSDYGDTWFPGAKDDRGFFEDFLLGVGTELKSDFVIGYGLPVTVRAGYAIIVVNNDRITGLTDPIFGQDLKNGTFYLQFGTSF